jgi:hypothetical protein
LSEYRLAAAVARPTLATYENKFFLNKNKSIIWNFE